MRVKLKKSRYHNQWDAAYLSGRGGMGSMMMGYTGPLTWCLKKLLYNLPKAIRKAREIRRQRT